MRTPPGAAVALLLAAALSGCLAPFSMGPLHIRIDMGSFAPSASLVSLDASGRHALLEGRATVHATGLVRTTERVEGVTVDLSLAHGPCPLGPAGIPERPAARATLSLGALNGTAPFEADLSAYALPGEAMSLYALAEPTGLGPGFAACRDVVATPGAAPMPLL